MLNACHYPAPWQTLGIGMKRLFESWTNSTEFAKADMFRWAFWTEFVWKKTDPAMTEFVEKTLNWSLGVSFQTAGSGHLRMEPWAFWWVWCIQMPRAVSFMVLRRVARAMSDMHCYFTNVWDWVKSFAWKHGESPTGSCFQTLMQRWAASFLVIREISCALDQADLLLCKCGRSHMMLRFHSVPY